MSRPLEMEYSAPARWTSAGISREFRLANYRSVSSLASGMKKTLIHGRKERFRKSVERGSDN